MQPSIPTASPILYTTVLERLDDTPPVIMSQGSSGGWGVGTFLLSDVVWIKKRQQKENEKEKEGRLEEVHLQSANVQRRNTVLNIFGVDRSHKQWRDDGWMEI